MGVHISANSAKWWPDPFANANEIYRNNFKRLVEGKKEIAIYGDCFIFRETLREFHLSNIYICWNNFQFPLMSLLSGRLRDG